MPAPKWVTVADDICDQIRDSRLAPGDRIPSAAQLEIIYHVSATPVQKMLTVLKTQGVLESVVGVGVFVTTSAPEIIRRPGWRVTNKAP